MGKSTITQTASPVAPQANVTAMPMAAPASMPAAPPAATPIPESDSSRYENGGSIRDFLGDINLVDVAISAFIIGGVLYSIHYFKFMMMLEKTGYTDMSSRMAKLESAMTAKQAEANATGKDYYRGRRGM
jgi:hypothetical protein